MKVNKKYRKQLKKFLSPEEVEKLLKYIRKPLTKSIKINTNKVTPNQFTTLNKQQWYTLESPNIKIPREKQKDLFYIDRKDRSLPLWKTFYHQSWFFYIQEIAAWIPPKLFHLKENNLILDMCASPWGKTIQLANYLQQEGNKKWFVISNDINRKRIFSLAWNINRMWAYNTGITNINGARFWKNLPESFDHILVDALCTWEWTWYKSVEAIKYWRPKQVKRISRIQSHLLASAVKAVKPWGSIIYSTCTMNPYENETNIKHILDTYSKYLELENIDIHQKSKGLTNLEQERNLTSKEASKVLRMRPHIQETGWFFIAKLKKTKSLYPKLENTTNYLQPDKLFNWFYSSNIQEKFKKFLKDVYGIKISTKYFAFIETNTQVYITSKKAFSLIDTLKFEKIWVPILISCWNKFIPTHYFWCLLWSYAKKNYIEVDYETAQNYAFKENIVLSKPKKSTYDYVVIRYKWYGIWVWKLEGKKIKNKYINT